jgi:hypothetical protein
MTRSKVLSHLAAYEKAQERVGDRREGLRLAVVEWKASGASIVEIARTPRLVAAVRLRPHRREVGMERMS